MRKSNKDLMGEIQRLREEIQQLRDMVSALFSIVFEDSEEGGEPFHEREGDFSIYN